MTGGESEISLQEMLFYSPKMTELSLPLYFVRDDGEGDAAVRFKWEF